LNVVINEPLFENTFKKLDNNEGTKMDRKVPGIVVFLTIFLIFCVTLTAMAGVYLAQVKAVAEQIITEELVVEEFMVVETAVPPLAAVESTDPQPEPEQITEQPAAEEIVVELEPEVAEAVGEALSFEDAMSGLPELADKLETCEPFTQTFVHPLMGGEMERRIIGLEGSDCIYQETMPNDGLMECRYSEELRISAAKYYRAMAQAESIQTDAEFSSDGESNVTTTLDGEVVEDPLQEAMNSGLCTISGY
jgi:hypothetical protein